MANWEKQVLRMAKNHTWKAPPGQANFVADRGAVRFNYPRSWLVIPTDDAIELHDRKPPKDDCLLKVSVMYLHPGIDWRGLALSSVLPDVIRDDVRGTISSGTVVSSPREDLELAWMETRFIDPVEHREACSRACLARAGTIMPFITMDFWPEDVGRFGPVWDEVLRSLRLGDYISDPLKGPRPIR